MFIEIGDWPIRVDISVKLSPTETNCPEDVRTAVVDVPAKVELEMIKEKTKNNRDFIELPYYCQKLHKVVMTQCDYSYFLSSICMGIIKTAFVIEI
ncbi:hypothetical protein AS4_36370 [Acinetobacter guillouiae]|nr:hypothetical protein AS4_36370 [Acinetobacter guillouiae]